MTVVAGATRKQAGIYYNFGAETGYNTKHPDAGMVCDGAFDDRAAFNTLVNTTMQPAGGTVEVVGVVRIGSNITIPANVVLDFKNGSYLSPGIGVTVTINGQMTGSITKRFTTSGTIVLGSTFRSWGVYPEWWGAVGCLPGDVTPPDDAVPIIACLTTAANRQVIFTAPAYYSSKTWNIKRCVHLVGLGGGGTEVSLEVYPTVLRFPNNIPGIIVHRHNTNADDAGVMRVEGSTTGGDGTTINFLHIQGGTGGNPGAGDGLSHGVMLRARAALMNYKISGFKGDSLAVIGSVGSGVAATEGAPSGWLSLMSRHTNCGGSGIRTSGSDANAGVAFMADVAQCQKWGIENNAFLNNSFFGCQTAGNTLGSFTSTGINSAAVFIACYEETDQPGHVISYPSMILGGAMGLFGAGGTAPFIDAISGLLRANGAGFQSLKTGAGRTIFSTIGGDAVNGDFIRFSDSVNAPSDWRLHMSGVDLVFDYSNAGGFQTFRIPGPGTVSQNGRSSTIPHYFITDKLLIGNGGGARRITMATAAPAAGDWAIGDCVINSAPSASGGIIGWECVTAGTPGTWRVMGYMPGVSAANGDVAATLTPGSSHPTARWTSPLTVNRAVTLATASVLNGAKFRVVRTAAATGPSTLDVGTGPLKSLAVGQWCDVEFDGTNWILTGFGSL